MTEPTTPPTGAAGVSRDDRTTRLEALRLAVQTIEHVPDCPNAIYDSIHKAADAEALAVLAIAQRYRAFLEVGAP